MGRMYELVLGDALQILPTLAANSIDAIITDLPYGTTACSWDSVIPFAPMWEQVKRLLKPRGVFVTTASQPFTSALVMSNLAWFKYAWVWKKSLGTRSLDAAWRPLLFHEDVLVFADGRGTYNPQKQRGLMNHSHKTTNPAMSNVTGTPKYRTVQDMTGMKHPRTVLEFDALPSAGRYHPTQKPVALYAYLIRTYTNPGDTVMDFCMGSGTTGVAAIKEGRNFIGVELDAEYHAIAQKRIEDAAAQPMLLDVTA